MDTIPPAELTRPSLKIIRYNTPSEAEARFSNLDQNTLAQVADIYQEAFGGPPWFERFRCPECSNFSFGDGLCSICCNSQVQEAYPTEQLLEEFLPSSLATFTPGVLILAQNPRQGLLGFSTGGYVTLKELIQTKYDDSSKILRSIVDKTGIAQDTVLFYDNESCIDPTLQRQGIGTMLSKQRIQEAIEMGAKYICGRSINRPWINLKARQLKNRGCDVVSFVPSGDDYGVSNSPYLGEQGKADRFFYLATVSEIDI